MNGAAAWHDIECGSYAADLDAWERLAAAGEGPVLDLGCGTGRVALHLARRGAEVVAVDREPDLVAAMLDRAAAEGLELEGEVGDVLELDLARDFGLAIAPMQLVQLLPGPEERSRLLGRVAAHLRPRARAAFALVEDVPGPAGGPPPLPDVLEREGWVLSSLPLSLEVSPAAIRVRRLRQAVSPSGDLSEERVETGLCRLDAGALEREAAAHGLGPAGSERVPPSGDHVGSTIVTLEKVG